MGKRVLCRGSWLVRDSLESIWPCMGRDSAYLMLTRLMMWTCSNWSKVVGEKTLHSRSESYFHVGGDIARLRGDWELVEGLHCLQNVGKRKGKAYYCHSLELEEEKQGQLA